MIHLISNNGTTTANCITYSSSSSQAVTKCLRFIRNVLHLDANLGTYDSSSTCYKLLTQMAETQNFIEFRGKIFIPVLRPSTDIWGFIEVTCSPLKPTSAKIRKAVQAVKDVLEPEIEASPNAALVHEGNYSVLILESNFDGGHRIASSIFQSESYTSFINLGEWIQQEKSFSLKSLREFSGSLLFVSEILDLTKDQRSILALYSMLPDQLKKSSLITCTNLSFESLNQLIGDEKGFLSAFATKKAPFRKYLAKYH